jgi:hypothetical protein
MSKPREGWKLVLYIDLGEMNRRRSTRLGIDLLAEDWEEVESEIDQLLIGGDISINRLVKLIGRKPKIDEVRISKHGELRSFNPGLLSLQLRYYMIYDRSEKEYIRRQLRKVSYDHWNLEKN